MLREVRRLRMSDERHPNYQDIYEAHSYANQKCCIVELEWFIPHYGMKKWVISPEDNLEELIRNLHVNNPCPI